MNTYFRTLTPLALSLVFPSVLNAEAFTWKEKGSERSVLGEFVSRDEANITVKRSNGKEVTIPIASLDSTCQAHLDKNHPFLPEGEKPEVVGNAFGPLNFGDSRKEVEEKLVNSSLVTTKVEETFFGRTGLNGIFETAVPLGTLPCFLWFEWNDAGNLSEITIRTEGMEASAYDGKLRSTWDATIETLKKLYGKPLSGNPLPKQEELENGLMLASHLWRNNNGSILMGPGQEQGKYNVSIRFVEKTINPVVTP